MRYASYFPILLLAGCTAQATPDMVVTGRDIRPPDARLMAAPKALPVVKSGDSLYDAHAVCRAQYGTLATQVAGLQNYARVVTRKPKPRSATP